MNTLRTLHYGIRLLIKRPGHTALVIGIIGLAIGLSTAMFSIVYGTFLRGLPFEDSHQLAMLGRENLRAGLPRMPVPHGDFLVWREAQTSFDDIAAWTGASINISDTRDTPARYSCGYVTTNTLDLVRVQPFLGRGFEPGDGKLGAPLVVILGEKIWRTRFSADSTIIGQSVRLNGEAAVVIGVMPEGFAFPIAQELWVPLRVDSAHPEQSDRMLLQVFGRLKAGISIEQAQAEMKTIAELLARDQPDTHANISAHVMPYLEAYTDKDTRTTLYLMFAAVLVFLLLSTANISNLLLVRATSRYQEIAVRLALGATRGQVAIQLLLENLLLTAAGALLGLFVAKLAIQIYIYAHSTSAIFTDYWLGPFWVSIQLDPLVLLFVCGLTLIVSVISGIFPAFRVSGIDPNESLKQQARGLPTLVAGKFSKTLVVLQIALSTALLVGLGLLVRSISNVQNVDIGFDPENLFTAQVLLPQRYTDAEKQLRLYEVIQQRLAELPDARITAFASAVPGNRVRKISFQVEGRTYASEADQPSTRLATVSPGYFEAFGLKILKGRDFTLSDNLDTERVVFVNQRWVDRHFTDGDPLDSRIMLTRPGTDNHWLRIIGVVPNMWMGGFYDEDQDGVYVPLNQNPMPWATLVIKTRGAPLALTDRVREAVAYTDPDMPIFWQASMKQIIDNGNYSRGLVSTVFVVFGFAALFLAATGLYGILSFLIRLRAQELGLRMALGAEKGDIAYLILKEILIQVGLGLILGLGLAASFSGLLRAYLFNVESQDWISFIGVTIVMVLTGLLSAWPPVRWATRIDPMAVLHDM